MTGSGTQDKCLNLSDSREDYLHSGDEGPFQPRRCYLDVRFRLILRQGIQKTQDSLLAQSPVPALDSMGLTSTYPVLGATVPLDPLTVGLKRIYQTLRERTGVEYLSI